MISESFQPDWFSKPGDTLADMMTRKEVSRRDLAERLHLDQRTVTQIVAGIAPIDRPLADQLSQIIGGSPTFWMNRQEAYERSLSRAVENVAESVATQWLKNFSAADLERKGLIAGAARKSDRTRALLAYFSVSSPEEWTSKYAARVSEYSFRTSSTFDSKLGPLTTWLRQGEIEASAIPTADWDAEVLRSRLAEIRKLSWWKSPKIFLPKLQAICASAGVAVVVVRAPSGCRASGATRFLNDRKAMLLVSFRYLSDDQFWFTVFHEIGHLMLHGRDDTFIDGEGQNEDIREREANEFSSRTLVPPNRQSEMINLPARANAIMRFAADVGVAPGIVVGQMQHLGAMGQHQMNFLKRRYDWDAIQTALA